MDQFAILWGFYHNSVAFSPQTGPGREHGLALLSERINNHRQLTASAQAASNE